VALFMVLFRQRLATALGNLSAESYQEILFLVFVIIAIIIACLSFIRNFSVIPVTGVLCCLYLMIEIPAKSWMVFFGWMTIGLSVYLFYGRRKSKLAQKNA